MFAHPWWFLLLIVVAGLAVGYWWINRRRQRYTMRFTNLALLERVAPKGPGRWRHVPMALVLVALVLWSSIWGAPTCVMWFGCCCPSPRVAQRVSPLLSLAHRYRYFA